MERKQQSSGFNLHKEEWPSLDGSRPSGPIHPVNPQFYDRRGGRNQPLRSIDPPVTRYGARTNRPPPQRHPHSQSREGAYDYQAEQQYTGPSAHMKKTGEQKEEACLNGELQTKAKKTFGLVSKQELEVDNNILLEELKKDNYKEKFHLLLYWEEHEHEAVLRDHCNGLYRIAMPPRGRIYPKWLVQKIQQKGYTVVEICGLTEDQCDYVKQAATQANIFLNEEESQNADILHVDFRSSEKPILLVGMKYFPVQLKGSEGNARNLTTPKHAVQFQLKHSYFENLHRAVECVSEDTIAKLFPSKDSFVSYHEFAKKVSLRRPSMDQFSLDYDYQLDTMKDVLFCHPSAPFIITGPFGTGKTRMLATAAFMILKRCGRRVEGDPIRVLLVTHHLQTADSYLDLYFGPAVHSGELASGRVVRLISLPQAQYRYDGNYGKFISSVNEQQGSIHRYQLVITTLLTSLHLVSQCGLQPGFFTHILVDEAAQAREPEVVAALALADEDTKIVLAGDHLQVGPQTLVLGKEARNNGLDVSLLRRLHKCYNLPQNKEIARKYSSAMLTNYRSHWQIVRAISHLFYASSLKVRAPESDGHPNARGSSLHFICSSLRQGQDCILSNEENLKMECKKEAEIIVDTVLDYVIPWPEREWGPEDLDSICIIAPSRMSQRVVRRELGKCGMNDVNVTVAFDIQGREYRAIFVCTSEPVNPDGSSANPTKSVCDKFVFNTVITRAQSLVVAVGNPYRLFKIEEMSPNGKGCWKEYMRQCLKRRSVSGVRRDHIHTLRRLLGFGEVDDCSDESSEDDILEEYRDAKMGKRLASKKRKHRIVDVAWQGQYSHQPMNLVSNPQQDFKLIEDTQRAAQMSKDSQKESSVSKSSPQHSVSEVEYPLSRSGLSSVASTPKTAAGTSKTASSLNTRTESSSSTSLSKNTARPYTVASTPKSNVVHPTVADTPRNIASSSTFVNITRNVARPTAFTHPRQHYNKSKMDGYPLPPECKLMTDQKLAMLDIPLSSYTYQEKFHYLLYLEELKHNDVLLNKCNGTYTMYFENERRFKGPVWQTLNKDGYSVAIHGMTADNCEYAKQAAQGGTVRSEGLKVSATMLSMSSDDGKAILYLWLDKNPWQVQFKDGITVDIEFHLKHSYFENLHKAVDYFSEDTVTVRKLLPNEYNSDMHYATIEDDLLCNKMPPSFKVDNEYQHHALKRLISSRPCAPYLITGPFGTGKTRLLAAAAYQIISGVGSPKDPLKHKNRTKRVLLVTHHMQTADSYLELYFGPEASRNTHIKVCRLCGDNYKLKSFKYEKLYVAHKYLENYSEYNLIITTLLTAPRILRKIGRGFFTHILVDEAAQAREPEVVAALALADRDTKIVLAGDHLQVGPETLVLGEEARRGGLGTSLLVRLSESYEKSKIKGYSTSLLTNFRSNPGILRLPSHLFYESTLQACIHEQTSKLMTSASFHSTMSHHSKSSQLHPKTDHPLHFICTSLEQGDSCVLHDESKLRQVFEDEARTILKVVKSYVQPWPVEWGKKELSSICIIAPLRHQQYVLDNLIKNSKEFESLRNVTRNVAFDIQGREYRAIFVCTSEPVNPDGSSANPTKSVCDKFVFNTVITRAQSLVVAVGNPYQLFKIEEKSPNGRGCWKEYMRHCIECRTLFSSDSQKNDRQKKMEELQQSIFKDFDQPLVKKEPLAQSEDAILEAYIRAVSDRSTERGGINRRAKLQLRTIDGDQGWCVWTGEHNDSKQPPSSQSKSEPCSGSVVKCILQQVSHRFCIAKPLKPSRKEIHIQGVENRRGAFDSATVKVEVLQESEEHDYGKVIKVVKQGEDCKQFICRVDPYNSICFLPVDKRSPRIINLPPISRGLVELESGMKPTPGGTQKFKVHDVICFDPSTVEAGIVPKVRESIPMKIAQNLLFIVWPLNWNNERRYPLGVVVGVLPRGDSMFHAERLLKLKYHVEELTESYDDDNDGVPEVVDKVDWDGAITIDPEDAFNLDDALTLKCVSIEENGDQLFEFGVHIANVAKNLPLGHSLDKLIRRRITSVYGSCQGKNSYQPMLPHSYSKNLSLNEHMSRYCVSVVARAVLRHGSTIMEIVGNGSAEIKEGIILSGLRLTYQEADNILSQSEGCVSDAMRERLANYQQRYPGRTPVEGQLKYLCGISTSLRKSRLGEKGGVYFATDAETAQSPVAHGLVEEMMIWANSKVAHKLIHSSLPNIVLRIQPFPNVKELEAFQKDFASIIQSNIQFARIPCGTEVKPDSFVMLLDVWKEVVELLKQGKYGPARTMLTSTYLHPQLAVVDANLAKMQSKSAYHMKGEGRHRTGPDSENLKHYSLNTEYTHFTSPLRRAVDIVVQRLLQEALKANPPSSSGVYTLDELKDIIQRCNVKTRQANCFDNDLKVLDNALFNSRSSSCVTAYVAAFTGGKIELYFQDMRLRHIPLWEKCIRTSVLMSQASEEQNLSTPVDDSDGIKSTWRLRFTTDDDSLSSLCGKNFSSVNFASKGYSPETNRQSLLQYYVHKKSKVGPLEKHQAACDHFPTTVEVSPKCWAEVQKFIMTPNDRSAQDALRILTGCGHMKGTNHKENSSNECFKEIVKEDNVAGTSDEDGSDDSIDTGTSDDTDDSSTDDMDYDYESRTDSGSDEVSGNDCDGNGDNLRKNLTQSDSLDCQKLADMSIFCSLKIPVEIKEFKFVKVWLRAKYSEYILTPSIQMLDLAPHLQICIQHLTTPATCFAPTILKQASKPHYNKIEEYVELWEDVFLAEAVSTSVRSTKSSLRMTMVKNVRIRWPALTIPSNAIGEPYYVPSGPLHIELSKKFCAEKLDFFPFNVGTLICARYCIPLQDNEMKVLADLYHLKYGTEKDKKAAIEKLLGDNIDGHVRAVYHMVVTKIEEEGPASEGQEQLEQKVGRDRKMKPLKVKTGPIKVSLEMRGEYNQRVSDVMQSLLATESYPCDVQLLPLNTPHHRVYNSLRHLPWLRGKEGPSTIDVLLGEDHHLTKTGSRKAIENFLDNHKDVVEMWGTKKSLNKLQQEALKQGMENKFQLIQGPPGTGKSVTGAHLAYAFALWNRQRRVKNSERIPCVVYCGPSNKSVEVVLRLLQPVAKEVNILRIYGRRIENKDYTPRLSTDFTGESATDHECPKDLAQYALHHKVHKESEQKEQIADLEKNFEEHHSKGFIPSAEDRKNHKNLISEAEASVIADGNYDIVLCTCNECFSPRFRQYIQPVQVIIDEAAMAMEPECLAPVCQAEHVVLIGDHKQLQPIIDNRNAKENGLGVSLFERLAPTDEDTSSSVPFISLNVQYRMHKAVCSFPSECFYDETLVPHKSARERSLPRLKSFWPNDKWPIAFYDVIKGHEDGSTGRRKISKDSKSNTVEAKKVVDIVSDLLGKYGVETSDVAILTPYVAQKARIKSILEERVDDWKKAQNKKKMKYLGKLKDIRVQTITESQGSEFGIVVLSTVRTQPVKEIENREVVQADRQWIREKLGFLTDPHQMCVGITRSKYGLIVVGNSVLLSYDHLWEQLVHHYKENRCFVKDHM